MSLTFAVFGALFVVDFVAGLIAREFEPGRENAGPTGRLFGMPPMEAGRELAFICWTGAILNATGLFSHWLLDPSFESNALGWGCVVAGLAGYYLGLFVSGIANAPARD